MAAMVQRRASSDRHSATRSGDTGLSLLRFVPYVLVEPLCRSNVQTRVLRVVTEGLVPLLQHVATIFQHRLCALLLHTRVPRQRTLALVIALPVCRRRDCAETQLQEQTPPPASTDRRGTDIG